MKDSESPNTAVERTHRWLSMRTSLALGAMAVLAALVGAYAAHVLLQANAGVQLHGATSLQPPKVLPDFELKDHRGLPFRPDDFLNRWSFVFFGFANCPGPCPATLTLLASVEKSLSTAAVKQKPQLIFVSLDPKRDTPSALQSFVGSFGSNVIGVTGSQPQLDALVAAFGVSSRTIPMADGDYAVDHSMAIFLADPRGRLSAIFTPPQTIESIVHDYQILVAAAGN